MRARNLKPGFFKNEDLAELKPLARILFQGLWCMADREGRLEDRPKRIKIEVLPYDDCNINKFLIDLNDRGFIQRYTINNNKFIQIVNFKKHQNPHIKEAESTIPAPDLSGANPVPTPEEHGSSPADSPFPITDSLNPSNMADSLPANGRDFANEFDKIFYPAYPNKKKPAYAKQSYIAKGKKGRLPPVEDLVAALREQEVSDDWVKDGGRFIPHPSSWINGEQWLNKPPEPKRQIAKF